MELKQIKELMAAMGRTGTQKMALKKEGFELTLERGSEGERYSLSIPEGGDDNPMRGDIELHRAQAFLKSATRHPHPSHPYPPVTENSGALPAVAGTEEAKGVFITSPMVGTYYSATSPDDPPFVKVGDLVDKGTVVCIVEAMKVMNEVKAGVSGLVAELLVENGQPIEFGSKLFRVVPQ